MTRLLTRRASRPSGIITPPPPAGNPSGFAMIGADLPGWTYLGGEDYDKACPLGQFPGTTYGATMIAHNGIEDTSRDLGRPVGYRGLYNSLTTCSVDPGSSVLRVHCFCNSAGQPQVAMLVPKFPPGNGPYAEPIGRRYSIVVRATGIVGNDFKLADLNWPGSNVWAEGEFNFPEAHAGTTNVQGFSHDLRNPANNAWVVNTGAAFTTWHRYEKEWVPAYGGNTARLTYYLDRGTPSAQSFTIPSGAVSYGVPIADMVRRNQFETKLSASLVAADSEVTWEIDHQEEWTFNPATAP